MAIKKTFSEGEFVSEFQSTSQGDYFSSDGLRALYNHYWDLSEEFQEDMEFDSVLMSTEFDEFSDIEQLMENYSYIYDNIFEADDDVEENLTSEEIEDEFLEYLNYNKTVIELDNGGFLVSEN